MAELDIDFSEIIDEGVAEAIHPVGSLEDVDVPTVTDEEDGICKALEEDNTLEDVYKSVLWGFAEEQRALRDYRITKEKSGKDIVMTASKRSQVLKYMVEALRIKTEILSDHGSLDVRGPKFRAVFKMFLDIVSETFDKVGIPAEYKEMFFHALSKNLDGWEERAEKIIKDTN